MLILGIGILVALALLSFILISLSDKEVEEINKEDNLDKIF
jgi:hypothetical protein